MTEDGLAIVAFEMLIEADAGTGFGQRRREGGLACLQGIAAQVVTVQLDQVEGVQEHGAVVAPIADAIDLGDAAPVAGDRLAVDDARARAQPGQRLDDQRAVELTRGKQCVQSRNGKRGWVRAPFSILMYVNIDRTRRN